ncbi:MAG: hypothetical protein RLZZ200_1037 [Pseudomonadota bacterium]|jgi:hypothetical protein
MRIENPWRLLREIVLVPLVLVLVAFHGFVGWHKAYSPREVLVQHSAWTVHLPNWLGRSVGWVELAATLALFTALLRPRLSRLGFIASLAFIVMEFVSAATHYLTQDGGSLVQNAVTILLSSLMALLFQRRQSGR